MVLLYNGMDPQRQEPLQVVGSIVDPSHKDVSTSAIEFVYSSMSIG